MPLISTNLDSPSFTVPFLLSRPFPSPLLTATLLIQAAVPVDLDPLISLIPPIQQPSPLGTAKLSPY